MTLLCIIYTQLEFVYGLYSACCEISIRSCLVWVRIYYFCAFMCEFKLIIDSASDVVIASKQVAALNIDDLFRFVFGLTRWSRLRLHRPKIEFNLCA